MNPNPVCEVRKEFAVHLLNELGIQKANLLAQNFSLFLNYLEELCGTDGREMAVVRTKLEEASYFAKRALALRPENNLNAQ